MSEGLNVAAELAKLRGEMTTSLARIEGQLNQIVTMDAQRARDIDALEARVAALEARRVPWPLVAAVSGAVSAAGAVVGILAQ